MATLSIGGVAFGLQSAQVAMEPEMDPAYASFFGDADARNVDVRVNVRVEEPTVSDALEPRFDSGRSWTLGYDRARAVYQLHLVHARSVRRPICIAEFDEAVGRVELVCSPRMLRETGDRLPNLLRYPLDQLLAMFRLATQGGIIVHATMIVRDGRAVVLCGRSGAGKTTLSRLVEQDSRFVIASDDRAILRVGPDGPVAYGTPWPGEGGHAAALRAPLCGLGFLRKDVTSGPSSISRRDALARLLPVSSIPWFDTARVDGCLSTCDALVSQVPTFDFAFSKTVGEVNDALDALFSGGSLGARTVGDGARGAAARDGQQHDTQPQER